MKILILGSTGAMGEELVPLLAENPDNILVITSRRKREASERVRFIQGNAMNLEFIASILKNDFYDVIVDFMLYSVKEFSERYELLLKSCKQYIFFSSARVYAATDRLVAEDSPRLLDVSTDKDFFADGEYSLTKAKEENILTKSHLKNWVIIRPYKTYNRNRLQLGVMEKEDWINRAIAGKTVVTLGDIGKLHTSLTSAKDTAKILQRIIGNGALNGETIQIANPENITWADVIDIYSSCVEKKCGHKIRIQAVKNTSDVELLLGNRYRIKYDGLVDRKFDDSKVKRIMGADFAWTPIRKGLTECVETYIEKVGYDRTIPDYKIEGAYDRLTGEVEPINNIHGFKNFVSYWLYRIFSVSAIKKVKSIVRKTS